MRDKIPRLFTEMQEGAKRIKRIVDDLKDFARRDTSATMEQLDLNSVAQAAVRLVEPSLRDATGHFMAEYARICQQYVEMRNGSNRSSSTCCSTPARPCRTKSARFLWQPDMINQPAPFF